MKKEVGRVSKIFENKIFIFFILAVLIFTSYSNALFNKFVWDDGYLIVENPYIKHFNFLPNLFVGDLVDSTTNRHLDSGYYRPLSMLSFMTDYRIWRLNPFGYHLTNIFIHLFNSILVFLMIFEISRNTKLSFIASILFSVHPVHVEAVTPIYNRMGIQGTLFVLTALLLFIKSRDFKNETLLMISLFVFFSGLLSKEDTIVLPLIFLSYDYFYLSHLKFRNLVVKRKRKFYLSCLLIWGVYFLIRALNITRQIPWPFFDSHIKGHALAPDLFFHILTVIQILSGYIIKATLPTDLSPVYWIDSVKHIVNAQFLLSLSVVVFLIVLVFYLRKKSRNVSFAIVFFLISVFPFINLIPMGMIYTFYERFLYLPSVATCFIYAIIVTYLLEKTRTSILFQKLIYITVVVLTVTFSFATLILNFTWRTDLSLWSHAVLKSPDNYMARLNLGAAYLITEKYNQATKEFATAIEQSRFKYVSPDGVYLTKLDLAKIHTETGALDMAMAEIKEAMSIAQATHINPFAVHDKLGLLYAKLGRKGEAEEHFRKALTTNINFVPSYYNLGVVYFEEGKFDDAKKLFQHALSLDPDFAHAMLALGLVYVREGKRKEAKSIFQEALRIDPNFNLAWQYLHMINGGGNKQ